VSWKPRQAAARENSFARPTVLLLVTLRELITATRAHWKLCVCVCVCVCVRVCISARNGSRVISCLEGTKEHATICSLSMPLILAFQVAALGLPRVVTQGNDANERK